MSALVDSYCQPIHELAHPPRVPLAVEAPRTMRLGVAWRF